MPKVFIGSDGRGIKPERFYAYEYFTIDLNDEGFQLVHQWWDLAIETDHIISGVLSDWLTENRDWIIADQPADAVAALDALIDHLRQRCVMANY